MRVGYGSVINPIERTVESATETVGNSEEVFYV